MVSGVTAVTMTTQSEQGFIMQTQSESMPAEMEARLPDVRRVSDVTAIQAPADEPQIRRRIDDAAFLARQTESSPARPTSQDQIDLTLFIACYDEEENIVPTLEVVVDALKEFDFRWEILVTDDASRDRSVEVIQEYIKAHPELPITLRINPTNQGLAYNYVEGAFWGRGKYYRLICGDNAEPKETLMEAFRHLGAADIVLFYQDQLGRSRFRKALSRSFTTLVNLISGHRINYYNGSATHLRYNVMRWHPNSHGFGFQADLVTRLLDLGATYTQVHVTAYERPTGKSKALKIKNWLSVAHTLLDLVIRRIGRDFFKR